MSASRSAKPRKPSPRKRIRSAQDRVFDARRDTVDFRDLMYVPTLIEVPSVRKLQDYRRLRIPILDQGQEGACTGFGLATVVHYLLGTRRVVPDDARISPFMLYSLARRYDEWAGEDYSGSSCRGAIKAWHKHGVCRLDRWPETKPGKPMSEDLVNDAASRPLGAYYRVNHRDLVAMHAALSETGILYASATVHAGWDEIGADGKIRLSERKLGGHAFAIVAYDARGFWIQNSWGSDWGHHGFCHVSYDDWLENGTDVWVARLGVPVALESRAAKGASGWAGPVRAAAWSYQDLRPHVISIGNDGLLDRKGDFGTHIEQVREIVHRDIPRLTAGWKKARVVLYAHGGLVGRDDALGRVEDYRQAMLDAQCYPLAFIWKTDLWTTITNILSDGLKQRRPEGVIDASKDFMMDFLDDALEPLARGLGGRALWKEMKENAIASTVSDLGGARLVATELAALAASDPRVEFHVVGHSAGSIFHAPLVQLLGTQGTIARGPMQGATGLGQSIATCTLWAPAITTALFRDTFLPMVGTRIEDFALFTMDDKTERDDHCAKIYNKSLLYLVSGAFEDTARIPVFRPDGEALLGLQRDVSRDSRIKAVFRGGHADWVVSPTQGLPSGDPNASQALAHGDFDDDPHTVRATLARIVGKAAGGKVSFTFAPGSSSRRALRGLVSTNARAQS